MTQQRQSLLHDVGDDSGGSREHMMSHQGRVDAAACSHVLERSDGGGVHVEQSTGAATSVGVTGVTGMTGVHSGVLTSS